MRSNVWLILLLAGVSPPMLAQERGGFIVRMGTDTLAAERFSRSATQLEGEVVSLVPMARAVRYRAALNPDGTVSRFEISGEPAAPGATGLRTSAEVRFVGDSAHTVATRGDSTLRFSVAPGAGTLPFVPFTYALYEQLARRLQQSGRDSVSVVTLTPGQQQP